MSSVLIQVEVGMGALGAICGTTDTVVLTLAIKSIKAQPRRIQQ